MTTSSKLVLTKKYNQKQITVSVQTTGLEVSMPLSDFLACIAEEAARKLAADAARNAGNPAVLMTNQQLSTRLESAIDHNEVFTSLTAAADTVIGVMKSASVVAE